MSLCYNTPAAERDLAVQIRVQAKHGRCRGKIATILDVETSEVRRIAAKYKIRMRSYRASAKGAWGSPNIPKVPELAQTDLQRAITLMQRRGRIVYDAYIDGGPNGMIRVDHRVLTPEQVIAKAVRFYGYEKKEAL